jgi:hypothetical protein
MATAYDQDGERVDLDVVLTGIERDLAEIRQLRAQTDRTRQETRFAPWVLVVTLLGGAAAFFAAGAAFMTLVLR